MTKLVGKITSYDKEWFEIEKKKNKTKEIEYYRIELIKAITVKED